MVCEHPDRARATDAERRAISIDKGVARFAMPSDSMFYAPLNGFKRHQDRLRKAAASDEPKSEVQLQLEEGKIARPEDSHPHRQRPPRLPAQDLDLDQGWFEFRCHLYYKLAWKGDWLVTGAPQNTSRTCPCCGHSATP